MSEVMQWSKESEWECFCDEAYYGKWAVRPKGETRWGHCFHANSQEEAEGLVELLTTSGKEIQRLEKVVDKAYLRLYGSVGEGFEGPMVEAIGDTMDILNKEGLNGKYSGGFDEVSDARD
jgi:hypothetical protein